MKAHKLILFIALISVSTKTFSQAKYDKAIKATEDKYEIGDYRKAISGLEKFKSKAFKKLGAQNAYTANYYYLMAKYHLATGKITDFESSVQTAISTSIVSNKESSQKHGQRLADIAELYILNGSFKVARDYLDRSKKIRVEGNFMTDAIKARWGMLQAEAFTGQGYYREAIDILREQEKFYAGRAVKSETFVDDKGNLKSQRVPDDQLKIRYQDYARWMTDLANAFRGQGSFNSADSAFASAAKRVSQISHPPCIILIPDFQLII